MNPVAYYLVLFGAYDRLPGQEAMALNYTWALAMAFLAVPILGQRLTRTDVAAGLIAYAGVWVIATRGAVFGRGLRRPARRGHGAGLDADLGALLAAQRPRSPPAAGGPQWQNFSVGVPVLTALLLAGPGLAWHG